MDEFLRHLRKYDSKKMNEVREIVFQPDRSNQRQKYKAMDERLRRLVKNAPLLNDESIRVFLQAISLALQGLEEDLDIKNDKENNATMNENITEEQFEEIGEQFEEIDEYYE